MNGYSTRQAAKKLGLSTATMNRYIAAKKIPIPPLTQVGGVIVRLWSERDIAKALAALPHVEGRRIRSQKQSTK